MSDALYNAWYVIVFLLGLILAVLIAIMRRPKPESIKSDLDDLKEKLDLISSTLDKIEMNTDTEWKEKIRRRETNAP